jgi:hypothetical protein
MSKLTRRLREHLTLKWMARSKIGETYQMVPPNLIEEAIIAIDDLTRENEQYARALTIEKSRKCPDCRDPEGH